MRTYRISTLFEKKISKLKGQELKNFLKKFDEIIAATDINYYKNLKYDLKSYKRVHVNNSYVILFFDENQIIYFVDYEHHDNVYKYDKKSLEKYRNLTFK